jgi:5'-nucleotidase
MTTNVVVTNDDGIDSPGLHTLARCAQEAGWATTIAAPASESSGTSAGLSAARDDRQIEVEERAIAGLPGVPAFAVAAHPGLVALIACRGGFGDRPDVMLSGVNRGGNIGRAVLHSGTVGAALTAAVNGVRSMAVSLDIALDAAAAPHWETAAVVVRDLLELVDRIPPETVLNINVPDLPADQVGPLKWVRLATYGRVQSKVTMVGEGLIEVGNVTVEGELEPGTDAASLADGQVTGTPLSPIGVDERTLWRLCGHPRVRDTAARESAAGRRSIFESPSDGTRADV